MVYYVRKFEMNKWALSLTEEQTGDLIYADPCSSCLRTKDNKLSVWKIDCDIDNENNLKNKLLDIALAMVTSMNKIDQYQFICLPVYEIKELNIKIEKAPGNTPIEYLSDLHENLVDLRLKDIINLANLYIKYINISNHINIISREEVEKKVMHAIDNGILTPENKKGVVNKEILEKFNIKLGSVLDN